MTLTSFTPEPNADTGYTSARGEVKATFQEIVNAFGNPHHEGRFKSTPMEWVFKDDQEHVYTLFFWDVRGFYGKDADDIRQTTETLIWTIGCRANSNIDPFQYWLESEIAKKRKS